MQGKTFLTSIYCCTRCILFPQTKVIIASGNLKQATEVLTKIEDLRKDCPNLDREIENIKASKVDGVCTFHNGSWIRVVASNDGARSGRANLLIVDEFRMVDLDVINKVLRKFLTAPRHPKYLDKPEYKHLKPERNKEIYLSSAWYQYHWSWKKLKAFFASMIQSKKYFVCGLPYQLPMKEGLLIKEQVQDEMSEADFDSVGWEIEMECMFLGESEKAFFKFDDMQQNRVVSRPLFAKNDYSIIKDKNFSYEKKKEGEVRLLSCDIALMAGKNNDASVYMVTRLIPRKKSYERQVVNIQSMVGGHSNTQAIKIRQMFDDFDCDYLVLDTAGAGIGIYDQLVMDLYDKDRNITYEAWTCINDEKMADRCMVQDAPKKIYSIKANSQFNSEAYNALKDNLKRGKIKLLVEDKDGELNMMKLNGWIDLSIETQVKFLESFKQTTLLINEAVNLENVGVDNIVKLKEQSGQRKDHVSALNYMNIVSNWLEKENFKTAKNRKYDELEFFKKVNKPYSNQNRVGGFGLW